MGRHSSPPFLSSLVLFKLARVIYHSLLFSLQKTCLLERKNELEMKELEGASEQGLEISKAYFRGVVAGTFFHAHGSCASVLSFLFTRFFCHFLRFSSRAKRSCSPSRTMQFSVLPK